MSELPSPGPGRPHHSSYSSLGPTMSLVEAMAVVLVICFLAFIVLPLIF